MPVGPTIPRAASVFFWGMTGLLFVLGLSIEVRRELFLVVLALAVLFTFNCILDAHFTRSRREIYQKVSQSLDDALTKQDEAHRKYLEGIHDTVAMFATGRHLRAIRDDPRQSG